MPYFVFQINNHRTQACLATLDTYRAARDRVRGLRESCTEPGIVEYRMVFANEEAEALDLLRAPRERIPSEDD